MKKVFIVLFILMFNSVFSYAAVTKLNGSNPDSLVGTYKITFFYTKAPLNTITTDTDKCIQNEYGNIVECNHNIAEILYGKAQITKDKNGMYILENKMQIGNKLIANMSVNDVYQYTKYAPAKVSAGGLNADNKSKGFYGRNLREIIDDPAVSFQYVIKNNMLIGHIVIPNKCTSIGGKSISVSNVPTILHLEKISDDTDNNFSVSKLYYSKPFMDRDGKNVWEKFKKVPEKPAQECK